MVVFSLSGINIRGVSRFQGISEGPILSLTKGKFYNHMCISPLIIRLLYWPRTSVFLLPPLPSTHIYIHRGMGSLLIFIKTSKTGTELYRHKEAINRISIANPELREAFKGKMAFKPLSPKLYSPSLPTQARRQAGAVKGTWVGFYLIQILNLKTTQQRGRLCLPSISRMCF